MRISPRVAEKAFERLAEQYGAALRAERDRCPWPVEWLGFLKQARALKTESCVPAHQCVRIHDGQVSWYDKEPVEKHVSACLRCLEAWTGLREVGYWRHAAVQLSSSEDRTIAASHSHRTAAGQKKITVSASPLVTTRPAMPQIARELVNETGAAILPSSPSGEKSNRRSAGTRCTGPRTLRDAACGASAPPASIPATSRLSESASESLHKR